MKRAPEKVDSFQSELGTSILLDPPCVSKLQRMVQDRQRLGLSHRALVSEQPLTGPPTRDPLLELRRSLRRSPSLDIRAFDAKPFDLRGTPPSSGER